LYNKLMNFCPKVIEMIKRKTGLFLCLLIAALVLSGCAEEAVKGFTVTYAWNGQVLHTEQVMPGQLPKGFAVDAQGAVFEGWRSAAGETVDPKAVAVSGNVQYNAVIIPELTGHGAYLQLREGKALPDSVLTGADLQFALQALAAPGAAAYFPFLPSGNTPVEAGTLAAILKSFFPEADTASLFAGEVLVTRGQFAAGMHSLLGRSDEEVLALNEGAKVPEDLYLEHPHLIALLEATVPHSLSQEGVSWESMDVATKAEPGFMNMDGYLYYVQEDRRFLKDGKVGALRFGPDGRYTSGDAELDDMVAKVLAPIVAENPGATRLELLRIAYDHCHMDYKYLRRDPYGTGDRGWEIEDAKTMFSKGKGNCYNFAAVFWACARGLGYEARAVAGTCTSTVQPHGWVIINIDGADYFFDPEWQYAYRDRGDEGHDMFMIPMNKINYWKYQWRE